ncbi:general stress protein 26 [Saccharothrix tamanrassetensis]|uniref:General stress protein 26 n=1 Tax=Saccharothrix tamanrassetensis TaxID=1051531 RepID=A0A841CKD7_9PSEU|nr:pyridoxamine 5'-phosphate oxidase family protein [Saccharothrix tamanrassetensis]MBB5956086.1 general stress protein 26 [Saccharothrix tamanrassetensis]
MPATDIDRRYGDPDATPTPWATAEQRLASAEVFWLSTVRPDGRPHVTPLLAVWHGGALHVCTGQDERKARNLAGNPQVVLTTGDNALHGGLDVVVEGEAVRVVDRAELRALAGAWEAKYGSDWHFDVVDGGFADPHGVAYVFRVEPSTVFGFGKAPYSQTRFRFRTT